MKYINKSTRNLIYADAKGNKIIWKPQTLQNFNCDPVDIFGKIVGIESVEELLKGIDEPESKKLPKTAEGNKGKKSIQAMENQENEIAQ